MFRFHTDEVFIESAETGERHGPYKTKFSANGITIYDKTLDVSEGDKVLHKLPNGREERFTVVQSNYSSGLSSIPAHFTLKLHKDTAIQTSPPVKTTTNHIAIHNSQGIQIGDHNVQNLQLVLGEILQRIDDSGASREEREEAKNLLNAFLAHPLVAAIVGAGIPAALGLLS